MSNNLIQTILEDVSMFVDTSSQRGLEDLIMGIVNDIARQSHGPSTKITANIDVSLDGVITIESNLPIADVDAFYNAFNLGADADVPIPRHSIYAYVIVRALSHDVHVKVVSNGFVYVFDATPTSISTIGTVPTTPDVNSFVIAFRPNLSTLNVTRGDYVLINPTNLRRLERYYRDAISTLDLSFNFEVDESI